jgi:hypothetical protein
MIVPGGMNASVIWLVLPGVSRAVRFDGFLPLRWVAIRLMVLLAML